MKTIFFVNFFLVFLFLISCKKEDIQKTNKVNNNTLIIENKRSESSSKYDSVTLNDIKQDTISKVIVEQDQKDELNFEKFLTKEFNLTKKAKLDFSSNETAKYFKTRIIEAYKTNKTDFASYYIGVIFGCGADCVMGFIIDVRDGKIYDLPLGEEHYCSYSQDKAICKQNSRLFISNICKEDSEHGKVYYDVSLWDETKKKFEKVNENDILKK